MKAAGCSAATYRRSRSAWSRGSSRRQTAGCSEVEPAGTAAEGERAGRHLEAATLKQAGEQAAENHSRASLGLAADGPAAAAAAAGAAEQAAPAGEQLAADPASAAATAAVDPATATEDAMEADAEATASVPAAPASTARGTTEDSAELKGASAERWEAAAAEQSEPDLAHSVARSREDAAGEPRWRRTRGEPQAAARRAGHPAKDLPGARPSRWLDRADVRTALAIAERHRSAAG